MRHVNSGHTTTTIAVAIGLAAVDPMQVDADLRNLNGPHSDCGTQLFTATQNRASGRLRYPHQT